MKKNIIVKVLLLSLTTLVVSSVQLNAQVKEDDTGSHIRTVGGDNRFASELACPHFALHPQDVLHLTVHISGPEEKVNSIPWPYECSDAPRVGVFMEYGDHEVLVGYSQQIIQFQPGDGAPDLCSPKAIVSGHYCPNLYFANVSIPVDFRGYCFPSQSCEPILLEYRLIRDSRDPEVSHETLDLSTECQESLFPESCFCHSGEEVLSHQQEVWLTCNDFSSRVSVASDSKSASIPTTFFDAPISEDLQAVKLFPNPATEWILIQQQNINQKNISIQLVDNQGRSVIASSDILRLDENSIRIPTSHLSPGLYFCHISDGEKTVTKKIVKLRE